MKHFAIQPLMSLGVILMKKFTIVTFTRFVSVASVAVLLMLTTCNRSNISTANNPTDNSANSSSSSENANSTTATPSPTVTPPRSNTTSINSLDEDLIVQAAQDNLFDIQAGQLASRNATNASVKQFGQRMVQDHTEAARRLQQVASQRNITLPIEMGVQNRAVFDQLSGLSGAQFDQAYMNEVVNGYQKDLNLLRNQAERGKDPELKTLAARYVPAVEERLQAAQNLAQQLG
jgi:putative membrane protein